MADNGTEDEGKRQRKSPGTGFPSMPLNDAADAMRTAGAYGYEHQVAALAQYMGHSTTNSGAFKTKLASLRDFGLIAGRGDILSLSQLAQTLAHPEDDQAARDALQAAFFNCEVFAKVHDSQAKGVELEVEAIGNMAVRTFGIAPASKQAFIESFVASAIEARVAERVSDRRVRILAQGLSETPGDKPTSGDGERASAAKLPGRAEETVRLSSPAALHQEWDIGGGQLIIEIRMDRPLPAAAYSQIAKVVEEAQRLADLLVPDSGQSDSRPAAAEIS